ncbi:MAG: C1 family peptidase [Vicinamibacterales bacterium]
MRAAAGADGAVRVLDARPDTLDFRDRMFEPSLVEVPLRRPLEAYQAVGVPVLDQGREGACTGFGLATVVHYLLRTRRVDPDPDLVSPRMLYEMARRYDEWPGEDYEGSSARGAMKGWHKHGVCAEPSWVYAGRQDARRHGERFRDALRRPLGAYLRVNHKDLVAVHAAIAEVGILYATAAVHDGWTAVGPDGVVAFDDAVTPIGGHAFAIVGYDEHGLWVQNSWGPAWGREGFCRVSYDDWLANGSDLWVARLGAPVSLRAYASVSTGVNVTARGTRAYVFCDLRPHIVSLGNNGTLRTDGTYGTSADDVREIFGQVAAHPAGRRHLLVYAHGGLTAEDSAIQKVADLRGPLLDAGVYPVSLVWKTDFWTTLTNILRDAVSTRRPEGFLDGARDFMLDRLDDALEPVARAIGGKAQWDEMKENAALASAAGGGLVIVAEQLAQLQRRYPALQIHLVGHSAGAILLGGLVSRLTARGGKQRARIATCTLWAPACTIALYRRQYLPAITSGQVAHFSLFTLTDAAERDDHCANLYRKSLLYLVSNAFEQRLRKPYFGESDGEPLLGLEKFVRRLPERERPADWVLAPNAQSAGVRGACGSVTHGGFDDDPATLKATLARVLGAAGSEATFAHVHSGAANRARRAAIPAHGES